MKMGYLVILLGILCVALGCYMLKQSSVATDRTNSQNETEKIPSLEQEAANTDTVTTQQQNSPSEAEQKGVDFEKYVIKKFSKKYFTLKEWRSDKYVDGHYAKSNTYPDIELEFRLGNDKYILAVECKYRSKLNENGKLTWCDDAQLKRYQDYEKEFNIPVTIIIGIGGTPSSPDNIYCIPLKALKYNTCNEEYLSRFKHDRDRNFFYDTKKGVLE